MSVAITNFETLVEAARHQDEPQQLLLLFLKTVLPTEHTDLEARRFEQGQGGGLEPLFYVALAPNEVTSFEALVAESEKMETDWQVVLVACLAGQGGNAPTDDAIDNGLQVMQETVRAGGDLSQFIAFNRGGEPLHFR